MELVQDNLEPFLGSYLDELILSEFIVVELLTSINEWTRLTGYLLATTFKVLGGSLEKGSASSSSVMKSDFLSDISSRDLAKANL